MNTSTRYDEEKFFGNDQNLRNPDDLSGMESIEDLDSNITTDGFDALDPILLEEIRSLVRKKVDEINNPTMRSIVKLSHGIPMGPEDYIFSDIKGNIEIADGEALTPGDIAGVLREKYNKPDWHTKKSATTNKIRDIQKKGLKILGRDTYRKTRGGGIVWDDLYLPISGRPHARGDLEIGPEGISEEDFEEYMRIRNKTN